MPKYIDVEKVREVINNYGKAALDDGRRELDPVDDIILLASAVSVIPAADVTEVRRGRWLKSKNQFVSNTDGKHENVVSCSICGEPSASGFKTPYCSICGARMDGAE